MRAAPAIEYWEGGTRELWDGMALVRCGGHFARSTVAHVPHMHDGRGALLSAAVIKVAMPNRHAGFMRSFPNYIPLSARAVRRIAPAVQTYRFDAIEGAWWGRRIASAAWPALRPSDECRQPATP